MESLQVEHSDGRPRDILVVDDEPLIRAAIAALLKGWGYRVVTAENGMAALNVFREKEFEVVFLDLGMPEMNGYRVAEAMKGVKPDVSVVLVTGWGNDIDEERIEDAGIVKVVRKPFGPEELIGTLDEMAG
jgi:CheY-like chemotaxis protein